MGEDEEGEQGDRIHCAQRRFHNQEHTDSGRQERPDRARARESHDRSLHRSHRRPRRIRRKRPGCRDQGGRDKRLRHLRPREIPSPEERHLLRVPQDRRTPASQDQYLRSRIPPEEPDGVRYPRILPLQGLRLPEHSPYHRRRRGRRGADVPGHDTRPRERTAQQEGRARLRQGLLRKADQPDRKRPARGRTRSRSSG